MHAPIYVSGSGYLISGVAVECLYQEALVTKLIHLEDFFLTGVVAKKACGNKLKIVSHRYAHYNTENCFSLIFLVLLFLLEKMPLKMWNAN